MTAVPALAAVAWSSAKGPPGAALPDRGKRLAQLAMGDCRFPVGPAGRRARRFCGRLARAGGPYCDRHHAVAYIAADPDGSDAGTVDMGTVDMGTVDMGRAETGAIDAGRAETGAVDTGAADRPAARTGTAG